MSQLSPGAGRGTTETPVLLRLASRTDLPQRSRNLLTATFDLAHKAIGETLHASLSEFDKHLFKLCENSRSDTQQQNYMQSTQELSAKKAQLEALFFENVEDGFARVDRPVRVEKPTLAPAPRDALSLVGKDDLDESLAVQEFVVRNEVRHSQALYELGHRFAVLAAAPALEPQTVPVGPGSLGVALRRAAEVLRIQTDHRVLFYRIFDRLASKDLVALYDALNAYFVEQRILKHLRAQVVRVKKNAGPGGQAESTSAEQAQPEGAGTAENETSERETRRASSATAPADERDIELFSTLRELLAGSRGGHASAAAASTPSDYVPSEDLQGVLGALQNRSSAIFQPGGREMRSVAHLKQELLQQLRELSPGQTPHLTSEDSDTIDLVGMLFENMAGSLRGDAQTRRLLPRLQVPLLRVALRDKTFFTRKQHPARQLLNSIAETGERWMDGTDAAADQGPSPASPATADLLDRLGAASSGRWLRCFGCHRWICSAGPSFIARAYADVQGREVTELTPVDAAVRSQSREARAHAQKRETAAQAGE